MRRDVPANVKRAEMKMGLPPQITLNGQADRLSPGARIRNTQNLMVLSGSLVGQELPVVYRRDAAGMVHEVWILSAEEARAMPGGQRTIFNIITDSLAGKTSTANVTGPVTQPAAAPGSNQ